MYIQRNRLAWPHRRRELASEGLRYAGARSSVGRGVRIVAKLRLDRYGGVFLLLQERSKHPREMVNARGVNLNFADEVLHYSNVDCLHLKVPCAPK